MLSACLWKQTDSEQTDFAFDGEMTATESDADEDSEMRTQVHWARLAALLGASQPHNEMHRAAQNPATRHCYPSPIFTSASSASASA